MALSFAQQTFIGWPASQVNWRPTYFPVQARTRRLRLSPNWSRIDPDRLEAATRTFELSGLVNRNWSGTQGALVHFSRHLNLDLARHFR